MALLVVPAAAHAQVGFQETGVQGVTGGSIAVDDFNADSDPDLAVATVDLEAETGSVSVILGGIDGGFGAPASHAVSGLPESVAVGDFNGDSDPDLAVAQTEPDDPGTVAVLLGGAGGSFGPPTDFTVGLRPSSVGVGDFNADSDPDLAVVKWDAENPANLGAVSVLLGGAGGSFGPPSDFTVGLRPSSVGVGDFNADSDPDLAVVNRGSATVSVLLGGAAGSFGAPTDFAVGDVPDEVAVGDFNADSDPDLAVGKGAAGDVSVLLGGAGGSFGPATDFPAADIGGGEVAVGDFNADSDPDLAAGTSSVSVLPGGAGGSFGPATEFAASPRSTLAVAVGDFNADSDPDLAVARRQGGSILLNSTFGPEAPTITDTDPDSAASDNAPEVKGTAAANTTVRLYTTPDCSGTPAATGSAAAFASPGLTVSVPDDSTTTLRATTDDRGVISGCSTDSITYTEVSSPPSASLSAAPNLALTGDTVNFDASGTGGLAKTRYEWDLDGDGTFEVDTGSTPRTSRMYLEPGQVEAGVRVTNAIGLSDITTVPVVAKLRPPPGGVGVTINHGAEFTNDPNVTLSPVWPAYTTTLRVAGDGGFQDSAGFEVGEEIPWTLPSSSPDQTVYVRFDGNAPNYTDDIVLDQKAPTVERARIVEGGKEASANRRSTHRGKRTYRLRVRADDDVSGVSEIQVTSFKRHPGDWRSFDSTPKFRSNGHKVFVRVRDRAGNESDWRRAR